MFIEIAATDNADSLFGTSANEVSSLLGGNDYFSGAGGIDVVNGNIGNDTILGGDGNDTLYGGKGLDSIDGGAGSDFINGNLGNDTITDSDGRNTLRGGQGNDSIDGEGQIFGDLGNDTLSGQSLSNEFFTGGAGADVFVLDIYSVDRVKDFDFAEGDRIERFDFSNIYWGVLNTTGEAYVSYDSPITLFSSALILEGVDPNAINSSWFI